MYNNDKCAQCGRPCPLGRILCNNCLGTLIVEKVNILKEKDAKIAELEEKLKRSREIYEKLLEHVLEESQYTHELHMELYTAREKLNEGGEI